MAYEALSRRTYDVRFLYIAYRMVLNDVIFQSLAYPRVCTVDEWRTDDVPCDAVTLLLQTSEARWPSGRASDSGARGRGFDPHSGRRVVSLSKIHLPPKSTGNTKEAVAPSRHDLKIVDWDVKLKQNQIYYGRAALHD